MRVPSVRGDADRRLQSLFRVLVRSLARRRAGRGVVAAVLVWSVLGVGGPRTATAQALDTAADFRAIVQRAKDRVFPAVVYIRCLRESNESGKRVLTTATGSGVITSNDGEILTNWHVIDRATEIRCLLSDGRAFDATLIGSDKSVDLALIRLDLEGASPDVPFAEGGTSATLTEGDFVMAMGAPWGLNRSVSIGIVSATRRYLPETSEYSHWLQTDAAINPGNSGGPLVDTEGRIVGINTRGMTMADGMGFAIPYDTVEMLVPYLRDEGAVPWAWTGLRLQPLRDFDRDVVFEGDSGVIVAETEPSSPAQEAGLRPRDRIISVNGSPVTAMSAEMLPDVRRVLGFLAEGQPAQLEVVRGDETLQLTLTPRAKGSIEGAELECPRWDIAVKEINQFDNEDLYFYRESGVFVFAVEWPGNGASSGLQENDILLQIDGEAVETLADVKRLHDQTVANVAKEPRVLVQVMRGGLVRQLVLDLTRDYDRR